MLQKSKSKQIVGQNSLARAGFKKPHSECSRTILSKPANGKNSSSTVAPADVQGAGIPTGQSKKP